jgi:large subunit ribosomal protein L6
MSRIGLKPIVVPDKVSIDIHGNEVTVKGPKGELRRLFHPHMQIALKRCSVMRRRSSAVTGHCTA